MPKQLLENPEWGASVLALILGIAVWGWRALAVGMRLGELTQEVKRLRLDSTASALETNQRIAHLQARFDAHIDKPGGD